jgi:hypothetical protein
MAFAGLIKTRIINIKKFKKEENIMFFDDIGDRISSGIGQAISIGIDIARLNHSINKYNRALAELEAIGKST